jgi:hypothetical protein
MGDEIREIHREPCICGSGHFVVIEREPDYAFADLSNRSWKGRVECDQCHPKFLIEHRPPHFSVVRRSDVERAKAAQDAAYQRSREFMASPDVMAVKKALITRLESLPSKAAIYRFLNNGGFPAYNTQGTFTRNYADAEGWVRLHVAWPSKIIAVLSLLSRSNASLVAAATELENSEALAKTECEPVSTLSIQKP